MVEVPLFHLATKGDEGITQMPRIRIVADQITVRVSGIMFSVDDWPVISITPSAALT